MPTYFPQINSNLIMTQLPYSTDQGFGTIVQDVESGPRFTYPMRGAGHSGFPTGPLGRFNLNFPNITDAEVSTLKAFHASMSGRWGAFRFLDPGGNLLQYSEDFTQTYWDKSNGPVTVGGLVADPLGGGQCYSLTSGASISAVLGQVGPADGGMSGFIMCVSAWIQVQDPNQLIFIGFANSSFVLRGEYYRPTQGVWVRIKHTEVLWDNNAFRAIIGGAQSTFQGGRQMYVFGAQVVPMKGEGARVAAPSRWGYHANCRFDVDMFERQVGGPNQNTLSLPVVEFNV
jgi:hypothetical protein